MKTVLRRVVANVAKQSRLNSCEESMEPIHLDDYEDDDPDLYEYWGDDFDEINQLIDDYNQESSAEEKIVLLKKIQQVVQKVDYACSQKYIEDNPTYHIIRSKLFQQLQVEYANCSVTNLFGNGSEPLSLSAILTNMSPDKVDQMMAILETKTSHNKLGEYLSSTLYDTDSSSEAEAFLRFFQKHEIEFLGGNNSKNFKVTDGKGSDQVLKIENRGGMSKTVEAQLRKEHSDLFAPILAERHAYFGKDNMNISRTLLVTEFYNEGSVLSHSQQQKDVNERMNQGAKIFAQMSHALLKISASNGVFSDCKIENWLVNNEGKVIISDTKSLDSTTGGMGFYMNPGSIVTLPYNPPELQSGKNYDADKFHAYILGMNLYQYLTGSPEPQKPVDLHAKFDSLPNGAAYIELIEGLTKEAPQERMSVSDAMAKFKSLCAQVEQRQVIELSKSYKSQVNTSMKKPDKKADLDDMSTFRIGD